MVYYHLKVDYDKLNTYTIHPTLTIQLTKKRVIVYKPTKEIKIKKHVFNPVKTYKRENNKKDKTNEKQIEG